MNTFAKFLLVSCCIGAFSVGCGADATETIGSSQSAIGPKCEFGVDQTCNHYDWMSSLAGACQKDGACICKEGWEIKYDGKCGLPERQPIISGPGSCTE